MRRALRATATALVAATWAVVPVPGADAGTGAASSTRGAAPAPMPTHASTGPAATPAGEMSAAAWARGEPCEGRRVVGDVRVERWGGAGLPGRTWSATDCEFTGQVLLLVDGDYPRSAYPRLELTRVAVPEGLLLLGGIRATIVDSQIGGGYWAPCPDCTNRDWDRRRAMPIEVRDSLFFSWPPALEDGFHYEALHVMGSSTGMRFRNVRFYVRGPYNGTQSGAILFDADEARFRDVYFDFGGSPTASHYTAYVGGSASSDVTIRGCRIEQGLSGHIYPGGTGNHDSVAADWSGCVDWSTGAPVLPP